MAISRSTRTHMLYQFIILTLLFLAIGYNELLPERKFVLFITFLPMFLYQLLILSCCLELVPVPSWMSSCEPATRVETKTEKIGTDSLPSSPVSDVRKNKDEKESAELVEASDNTHEPRKREKSSRTIMQAQKSFSCPQRSKSWVNLNDSTRSLHEQSLSREGSIDLLPPKSDRKLRSSQALSKTERANYRKGRASRAKSWKDGFQGFLDTVYDKPKPAHATAKTRVPAAALPVAGVQEEESQLSKSYSFPFRQKRLETWLEMKDSGAGESNHSLDMPYWQTVGYNLAVKYEARRRRRAVSSPTKLNSSGEFSTSLLMRSVEVPKTQNAIHKQQSQKKTFRSGYGCVSKFSKLRTSLTSLVSKKKEDPDAAGANPGKGLKPSLSFMSRSRGVSYHQAKDGDQVSIHEVPRYAPDERPLIFYPKNIPFEKERFENDVREKMAELEKEQENGPERPYQHR